jgi:SRSO17 transposase
VQQSRLRLWLQEPSTAPSEQGVLLIDEQGDRQAGHTPAHIGRPDLANWGKLDQGVVSLTSLWAEERVYDPLDFERYTPAQHFEKGQQDPRFRSQLTSAGARLRRAVQAHIALRAVVAEAC